MSKISKYFTLEECTRADKRFGANIPNEQQKANIIALAVNILDPCREFIGAPLGVHSVFRAPAYNAAIGGDPNSEHMANGFTAAADPDCDIYGHGDNAKLFDYIAKNLPFNVLIWEFGTDERPEWIHVSHLSQGTNNRIIRRAVKVNGQTKYISYTR